MGFTYTPKIKNGRVNYIILMNFSYKDIRQISKNNC